MPTVNGLVLSIILWQCSKTGHPPHSEGCEFLSSSFIWAQKTWPHQWRALKVRPAFRSQHMYVPLYLLAASSTGHLWASHNRPVDHDHQTGPRQEQACHQTATAANTGNQNRNWPAAVHVQDCLRVQCAATVCSWGVQKMSERTLDTITGMLDRPNVWTSPVSMECMVSVSFRIPDRPESLSHWGGQNPLRVWLLSCQLQMTRSVSWF